MTTTTTAPVKPPARPAQKPLPAGAARWSKTWVDAQGLPRVTAHAVPVDESDRRTAHVRHVCSKGQIEVTLADGTTERRPCDQEVWLLPGEKKFCPDHSSPMEPTEKISGGIVPWGKLWAAAETPGRPLYALAAVAAAGYGLEQQASDPLGVAAATPLAAAGVWWATRVVLRKRAVSRGRIDADQQSGRRVEAINRVSRAAGYCTAVAGAWLSAAAAVDPHTLVGKVVWTSLPVAWAVCAGPWWRHLHALRNRPTPVEAVPGVEKPRAPTAREKAAAADAAAWAETVAGPMGLSGSWVDTATWEPDPGGRRMVVRSKGALTDEKMRQALPLIASAFDVKRAAIGWVEEFEGSPRSVQLLVQPKSPLDKPQEWIPPGVLDIDNAVLHVGTRLDGKPLYTRFWTPGWGAPSRSIYGTKGSGKTEAVRLMLLGQLLALVDTPNGPQRLVAPFLHDPKLGKDFGAFRRQVCGFSTSLETLHMIVDALIREMDRRYDSLATYTWRDHKGRLQEGEQPFDPTIHGPIISVWIDELHEPIKDKSLLEKLEPAARKMRAAGIEVNTATHMTTLGDTGSQAFRDMTAEEVFLFRTTSGLTSLATGGQLTGDPRLLPRVPGSLFHAAGEQDTVQSRFAYVPRDELYDMLYDDDNVSRTMPVVWPQAALDAFGPDFVEWMSQCQQRAPGAAAPALPTGSTRAAVAADDKVAAEKLWAILAKAGRPLTREEIKADPLWVNPATGKQMNISSTMTAAIKANEARIVKGTRGDGSNAKATYALADSARAHAAAVAQETQMELDLEKDAA